MMRKHRLTLFTALLVGVAACGGTETTEPVLTTPASMTIVSGDAQVDTVGKELPQPLVVRVLDLHDVAVRNQVVNFRVLSGNGSVFAGVAITDQVGEARERWTLGTVAGDAQTVEARAVDTQTGAPLVFATFTAVGVPDTAASLELVSGGVIVGSTTVRLGATFQGVTPQCAELCQRLRRYRPTLTDATDAEIQHFRRWPTPTDAREWLPKQVRYRTAPRPDVVVLQRVT